MEKKIIIIGLIIIILASCLILITSQDNTVDSDNYNQNNNTTKNNVSNDTTKNGSLNTNQITKSGKNVVSRINNNQTIESGEKRNDSNKIINFNKKTVNGFSQTNNSNTDNDSDPLEITAEDIKKCGERIGWNGKHGDEVIVGEPYMWSSYESGRQWLVPAFDKITGEFIGSVYIWAPYHKNGDGLFGTSYMMGPSSYSDYFDLISGKPITKPETILMGPENFTLNLAGFSDSQDVGGNSIISDEIILDTVVVRTDLNDDAIELNNSSCCE